MTKSMPPADLQICHEIHTGLTSKERNNINYLFLEPVDFSFHHDYPSIVSRPMDLRTLKENLDNGVYSTKEEFYNDAALIFENAILYNKDRDSKFVLKLAESMAKALERLRRNAEKRVARQLGTCASGSKTTSTAGVKGGEGNGGGGDAPKASGEGGGEGKMKTKKISIKLKRKSVTSESTTGASVGGGNDEISIAAAAGKGGAEANATTDIDNPRPTKKAKTKLRLSASSTGKSVRGEESSPTNSSSIKATKVKYTDGKAFESTPMNSARRAQCCKVLASLKRRQAAACRWFHKPVSDAAIVKNYRERVLNPMDLSAISSRLDKNQYSTIHDFVHDLRLIAANCLQFNSNANDAMKNDDSFRTIAVNFLDTSEKLCNFFIAQHESSSAKVNVYPPLLYCWVDIVKVLDELIQVVNPSDGTQTAWFFMEPVTYYCGGKYPEGYLEKVKKPIDFGTITQNLVTGRYTTVMQFASDCKQVVENCRLYYTGHDDGVILCEQSNRLLTCIMKHLTPLLDAEKKNTAIVTAPKPVMTIKRPKKEFLKEVMRDLRATTYTDKAVKITEKATLHFEKPVDTTMFTDYRNFVETPMDLETVDRKIESGAYVTPEDFEYDISLIFKNCDRYNGPKKNYHMVNLGKHTAKVFRKMFAEKMRGGSPAKRPVLPIVSNKVAVAAVGGKKRPASPSIEEQPAAKRVSIKAPSKTASKSVNLSVGKAASKSKLSSKLSPPKAQSKISHADNNAPLQIHVAIALIKESYPGRRQAKDLEEWETECLKFLRQLFKHPWVSAERPKYIFHVPVHYVFPEIRDSYAAKIRQPMDLTTAEAKLLKGVYQDADEFVSDTALVFSNAIAFNKEGRDVGEPMSCAYHEVSTHLLKYTRWLSLELLQPCLSTCSDGPVVESGSASSWKLTVQNRAMARKEMEFIVFSEHLDHTEPGEKFSWREQECDKLLKSLRHMSDVKHMSYFIPMNFPADYTTFISKPIAWDFCKDKLYERRYGTIGEVVADLRLIFTNALKYNEGARHVSKVSEMAYESAIHMSGKLEAAIDKLLLNVADRIGRDRIDLIVAHREKEAQERAQEEQRKLKWEADHPGSKEVVRTTLRIVNQSKSDRRKLSDFEYPFYDEGEGSQEESQADALQHARALYEKQRRAHANVQEIALSIGITVFRRLQERAAAKAAHHEHLERIRIEQERIDAIEEEKKINPSAEPKGEFVSAALNDSNRKHVKLSIQQQKHTRKAKKCKRPILWMGDD